MREEDVAHCCSVIQVALYPPDLHESTLPYLHRFRGYPPGCFVAVDGAGTIVGYGQSHPWGLPRPPSVTVPEDALEPIPGPHTRAEFADAVAASTDPSAPVLLTPSSSSPHPHYFIFDVSTTVQRQGVGEAIFRAIMRHATEELGYPEVRLVAVRGAHTYWARFGFEELRRIETGYGSNLAVYMIHRGRSS
jgi:GNAT superfamily N-acetyltransferase